MPAKSSWSIPNPTTLWFIERSHTLLHVQPYQFDRIFQTAKPAQEPLAAQDLSDEILRLGAEIASLKADRDDVAARARAEGFEAGLATARAERDAALLAATDMLQTSIEGIQKQMDVICAAVKRDATDVAIVAADVMAGFAVDREPVRALGEALDRALDQVGGDRRLVIRVHPDFAQNIRNLVTAREQAEHQALQIAVIPSPEMLLNDGAIEWAEGGLIVDATARRDMVMQELASLLGA